MHFSSPSRLKAKTANARAPFAPTSSSYLPGGRNLVIDSKVSLTAYTDCVNAADEDARKAALKLHMASVRGHISSLAKAGYHNLPGIEAPDFVVMFVPIEPAFLMALQCDGELWADAYKQGILLVGPTTLLYVIRIINVLWQQERQARNVQRRDESRHRTLREIRGIRHRYGTDRRQPPQDR